MTDIVDQLRSFAEDEDETVVAQAFYSEAADEIERLREIIEGLVANWPEAEANTYWVPADRAVLTKDAALSKARETLRHD